MLCRNQKNPLWISFSDVEANIIDYATYEVLCCAQHNKSMTSTIHKNLLKIKSIIKSRITDDAIYQASMTRLGLYRQCGLSTINLLLRPQVLGLPRVNRADKSKSRPGLVDPYALYQSLRSPICM